MPLIPININEPAASNNVNSVVPTRCSMPSKQMEEILSARIYSDAPGFEKLLQLKKQGRIITSLKKHLL